MSRSDKRSHRPRRNRSAQRCFTSVGQLSPTGAAQPMSLWNRVPCALVRFFMPVSRVVYGARDPKNRCSWQRGHLFAIDRLNHHTTVLGGVLSRESYGNLSLSEFFRCSPEKESLKVRISIAGQVLI